ncbi:cadherin-17 isoform X1 [Pleurodeles waltl]|uniref:cadherin-17 isoform X1 n=1 Tax=Pleurodeles waltl TaxID=8319 RepID=UPI0037098D78
MLFPPELKCHQAIDMQRHLSLCILIYFSFFLAASHGQSDSLFSTPLKDVDITLPERFYDEDIHQFHKSKASVVRFELIGETERIFHITPINGTLRLIGTLDREKKSSYKLKVQATDSNNVVVEGPFSINVFVEDVNDNAPVFNQSAYAAVVRERSRVGKTFITVYATDADEPGTPNAQLFYKIVHQIPAMDGVMLFSINSETGEISTTSEGFNLIDAEKTANFKLQILVTDLAGLSEMALADSASVFINVTKSLWKTPAPVEIIENSTMAHPIKITEVRCNEPNAKYELLQKEKLPSFPFSIDQNGDIFVTEPLDRESKSMYIFYASAKDKNGNWLERPVQVEVNVKDINDNPPVCGQSLTRFEVQENEGIGAIIGDLDASDQDLNVNLNFKVLDQIPKFPEDNMFKIKDFTSSLQLTKSQFQKKKVSQYNVTVEVSDEAVAPSNTVFKTICLVQINVIDINKHPPIFDNFDYGNLTFSEDTAVGTVILEIQATDADEPFTGSSAIIYSVKEGDPENVLLFETDPVHNKGYVKIHKPLDFETFPEYSILVEARNPEPLTKGVSYGEKSNTRFRIKVTNVDEPPIFNTTIYQFQVLENTPVGTRLSKVMAHDPEGGAIRYSIVGDKRNWLKIDPESGEIFSAGDLDREQEATYAVRVVATERSNSAMKSEAPLFVSLDDVNDNAPRLASDQPEAFFCHPITKQETVVVEATDPDTLMNGPRFTFSLDDDETAKRNWKISPINMTHALLTMKHQDFEMKLHQVPIKIKDRGNPPKEGKVYVRVNVCSCTEARQCLREEPPASKFPSVGMAVGILVGVLAFIGIILGAVFISLNHKKKKEKKASTSDAKTQDETENLGL